MVVYCFWGQVYKSLTHKGGFSGTFMLKKKDKSMKPFLLAFKQFDQLDCLPLPLLGNFTPALIFINKTKYLTISKVIKKVIKEA